MLQIVRQLFGKASATTRLQVDAVRGSDAVWTPREFDKLIKEGYEHAVWAYACVSWLTRLARGVRWIVMDGDDEAEEHPLLDLLARPNEHQGGGAFVEAVQGYYLTSGNTYIERVGTEKMPPAELYVKRPDRMRVVPDPKNLIGGYVYEINQQKHHFKRWQIRHLKTWSPLNDWYGMSPLEAAARGIDVFNVGMAHNLALMQNGARPTGAWITKGTLTDIQFARMKEEVAEAARMARRGRPMVLEGGTTWQELGLSPRDLDFLAGQDSAARQIHAAYGVHPVVTGLTEGTFENQQQSLRALMVNAVLPFLDLLTRELNEWIVPLYGDNVVLKYDQDAFPALSEDQESLWRRAETGWSKGFLRRNEARVLVGFDELPPEQGDIFVNDMYQQPDPFAFAADPQWTIKDAGYAERPGLPPAKRETGLHTDSIDDATNATISDLLPNGMSPNTYARSKRRLQDQWTQRFRAHIASVFNGDRADLAAAFARAGPDADPAVVAEQALDPDRWDTLLPWWLAIMTASGSDAVAKLPPETRARADDMRRKAAGDDHVDDFFHDTFGVAAQEALEYAEQHVGRLKGDIGIFTRSLLRDIIADGVQHGQSIPHIARRIDDLYLERIIPKRSTVIARTETIRATNWGSQEAARGTGLQMQKVWMSNLDDRTRAPPDSPFDHWSADGQRRNLDDPYEVSGEHLMFPGDPRGSPGNTIQCFPPGTRVTARSVRGSIRSHYDGYLVTLHLATGDQLTGTPNHPVLTPRGWVALGHLQEGDEVVKGRVADALPSAEHQVVRTPTAIGEVHDALARAFGAIRPVGARVNLYGRVPDGEVEVVATNRVLRDGIEPASAEPVGERVLAAAPVAAAATAGASDGGEMRGGSRAAAGPVRGGDLRASLLGSHAAPLQPLGVAPPASGDARADEGAFDGLAADAELDRDAVLADALGVAGDDARVPVGVPPVDRLLQPGSDAVAAVTATSVARYVGHVHTLQTGGGWYTADGIIVGNCRCTEYYDEVHSPFVTPEEPYTWVPEDAPPHEWDEDAPPFDFPEGWVVEPEEPEPFFLDWEEARNLNTGRSMDFYQDIQGMPDGHEIISALENYTGSGFRNINGFLRGRITSRSLGSWRMDAIDDAIDWIDEAFNSRYAAIEQPQILYRGKTFALQDVPFTDLDKMIGTIVSDHAYMSTSINEKVGGSFVDTRARRRGRQGAFIEIEAPAGTKAIPVEHFTLAGGEDEVLMPRGTAVEIISAEMRPDNADAGIFGPYLHLRARVAEDFAVALQAPEPTAAQITGQPAPPFQPAQDHLDAQEYAMDALGVHARYGQARVEIANETNRTLVDLQGHYGRIGNLRTIGPFDEPHVTSLAQVRYTRGWGPDEPMRAHLQLNPFFVSERVSEEELQGVLATMRETGLTRGMNSWEDIIAHEFGHLLGKDGQTFEQARNHERETLFMDGLADAVGQERMEAEMRETVGDYAFSTPGEFFAEAFRAYDTGMLPDNEVGDYITDYFERLREHRLAAQRERDALFEHVTWVN